ncbi:hypothetical protein ACQF4J_14310 [Streptomyces sp. C1-1]|uniref:hypothetical protein n=1 Tax=Streptomyces sp. C1-1 TaxID=3231173 RepID=UPI003CFFD860
MPHLIEEQPALAAIADRVSLQQAIKLARPGGPPVGGVAADATICNATVSLPTRTVNGWRGCTVEIDPEATASSNWEAALAGQLDKL